MLAICRGAPHLGPCPGARRPILNSRGMSQVVYKVIVARGEGRAALNFQQIFEWRPNGFITLFHIYGRTAIEGGFSFAFTNWITF